MRAIHSWLATGKDFRLLLRTALTICHRSTASARSKACQINRLRLAATACMLTATETSGLIAGGVITLCRKDVGRELASVESGKTFAPQVVMCTRIYQVEGRVRESAAGKSIVKRSPAVSCTGTVKATLRSRSRPGELRR